MVEALLRISAAKAESAKAPLSLLSTAQFDWILRCLRALILASASTERKSSAAKNENALSQLDVTALVPDFKHFLHSHWEREHLLIPASDRARHLASALLSSQQLLSLMDSACACSPPRRGQTCAIHEHSALVAHCSAFQCWNTQQRRRKTLRGSVGC